MTRERSIHDGSRHDITAAFVTRRIIDTDAGAVRRLLVDRDGESLALFVPPDQGQLPGLRTGATYRLEDVLGCWPVDADPTRVGDRECPDCGGPGRPGQPVDAHPAVRAAVEQLDLAAPFGIVDDRTRVVQPDRETGHVDDWQPRGDRSQSPVPEVVCSRFGRVIPHEKPILDAAMNASPAADEMLGFATGGAKDVGNFRENVRNGCVPQPESISEEGLFYDYHFRTDGVGPATDAAFAPRYAGGVSDHPVTGDRERYLAVGLDSTLSASAFERPPLDLVAVLDVSGSMDSPFDEYHYDQHGRRREQEGDATPKIEAATASLCALTEQLEATDRLGVVLFDSQAHVAKPLRAVGETDMAAIRSHVRAVAAGGGTNMADGFRAATELFDERDTAGDVERRVVFMTDAMPNVGTTAEDGLVDLVADAATDGIHTTFVGMGIDANATLVDALSGIRGANHYFVHSADEFERRLGAEFDFMVTPLVYDLALELDAEGYEIASVHGSPAADPTTGQLLDVGTLFPSPTTDGETRGGIVLVRLEETDDADPSLDLVASWTERDGGTHTERVAVELPDAGYDHDGVRKGVALTRYARLLRAWAEAKHESGDRSAGVDDWRGPERGEHERQSVPLVVPDEWADRFAAIEQYLATEAGTLDADFGEEFAVLERLLDAADATTQLEGQT